MGRRPATVSAITEASASLFAERGYAPTTVDDIAVRAGCSRRTFFRYFATKEDVVFVNAAALITEFEQCIAAPSPGSTRWDQICAGLARIIFRMTEPSSGIGEISIARWLSDPVFERSLGRLTAELDRRSIEFLAAWRGVDPESDLITQFLGRSATATYMSALRIHIRTERDLGTLLNEAHELLRSRTDIYS